MSQVEKRSYSRDFKLQAVKRLEAGESISALSEELSVKRTKLYRWRGIVRRDGKKAFPGHGGRRSKAELLARELDAFSRKVVGWALENHLTAALALGALEMALKDRNVVPGELVHHTDRGVQYACGDYIGRLEAAGIQPSMSLTCSPKTRPFETGVFS